MGEAMQKEKEPRQQIEALVRVSSEGIVVVDIDGVIRFANPAAERLLRKAPGAAIGYHLGYPAVSDQISEMKVVRGDTDVAIVEMRAVETSWEGEPAFVINLHDVTERRRAEAELRKSQELLTETGEMARVGGWEIDLDKGTVLWTETTRAIHEVPDGDVPTLEQAIDFFAPEVRPQLAEALRRAREEGIAFDLQLPFITARGRKLWVRAMGKPEFREGECIRLHGTFQNISELKEAVDERVAMEAKFYQAQKMESVGRLAGGVAHDFNNKLTVMMGYTQMALEDLRDTDPIHQNLQEVIKAGNQSVAIVRQLLAFARKQTIAPEVLDLNEVIEGMLRMLRRLMGEDIDLAWEPDNHLWSIKMDPVQIDQILANLCVNARDAVTGVGKVTIETENVVLEQSYCADHAGFVPGEYVILGVSDNGCGMDKETLTNAFEPFFTTKEVGRGTGLGLSTIYGIVRQNNGFVNLYSEPGKGTAVKIYLPRYRGEAQGKAEAGPTEIPRGHGETILLVEDDALVLDLTRITLEKLGYKLLTSGNPVHAIRMAREHHGDIHLLVTDVVLPEMSGKDLAGEIWKIRPAIRTLYMSGYTANMIAHQGVLDEGVHFIGKPFTPDSLGCKVREALSSKK